MQHAITLLVTQPNDVQVAARRLQEGRTGGVLD